MDTILSVLDQDARLTPEQVAEITGKPLGEVIDTIDQYEKDGVILGYKTVINWERTDRDLVTALIEVKVTPQNGMGFDQIAQMICKHKEVESVFLMSGGFDLTVIVNGRSMKDVASFVYEKLATMESVLSTGTHFVLRKYREMNVDYTVPGKDDREVWL
jgi:DNA-binding Lrp family transcriptional regulator